jgi:hypothetical protein
MNPIPADIVEKTWEKMIGMAPEEAPEMIERMTQEQPLILAYLMAMGDELFNPDEQELLLFLGIVIWQLMQQGDTLLPVVTENMIDEIEESNFKMLEYLEGEPEGDFNETVSSMLENYNQKEILTHVLEAIMEEPEEGSEISEEHQGMMMIYLKTVIDCFDR